MTAWHVGWLRGPRAVGPGHACEATSASRPARPGGRAGQQLGARGVWGQAGPTRLLGLVWLLASWAKGMDRPQAGPDGLSIFLFHFLSFYLLPIG